MPDFTPFLPDCDGRRDADSVGRCRVAPASGQVAGLVANVRDGPARRGLDPASVEARHLWVACLIKSGHKPEALAEFAKLRALRPPNLARMEAWFAEQMR